MSGGRAKRCLGGESSRTDRPNRMAPVVYSLP